MLDGNHYLTAQLVDQLISNAQTKSNLDLIESLKPELSIVDNNQGGKSYCYNYQNIILAFGDTIYSATLDFSRKFYCQQADGGAMWHNVQRVYEVNFANTKTTMECKQGI